MKISLHFLMENVKNSEIGKIIIHIFKIDLTNNTNMTYWFVY